jgi:hypothetical protein
MSDVGLKCWVSGAAALVVVGCLGFYATRPPSVPPFAAIVAGPPVHMIAPPVTYPPRWPSTMDSAIRDGLIEAGVGEDKVDWLTADLADTIDASIRKQIDELRWNGEIAIASLVPLWIIALVALFRHQRPPVNLRHLDSIVARAETLTPDHGYDTPMPFVRRR